MPENIRVRFAPSPTGPLHMGGVRTALYNYLFAKRNGGKMILRIEDTDQTRFVPGAEQYIMESLAWCGIQFDEGVAEGGAYGPYRQSERKSRYKAYADQLIQNGNAYYAFDTAEELDELRKQLEAKKKTFIYNVESRKALRNSLTLSENEVKILLAENTPYVIRFMIPENTSIHMKDLIRGEVTVKSETLDDKVLYKSDGMPTYHLANIVDDHLMKISHVIRGEEWLPSLPLHVLLYEAFGWEKPQFAHLPLLLKPDGNGKLSKRDGDRLGFPVFPLQWQDPKSGEISSGYRENGYYPEAFVNMLALLGWNPGSDQELFSMPELIQSFSLDRVGKSGSKFDPEKTKWFNHQYLIQKTDDQLVKEWEQWLKTHKSLEPGTEMLLKIIPLIKERVSFVKELWEESFFFFEAPESYDEKVVKKRWKADSAAQMKTLAGILNEVSDFSAENIDEKIKSWITANELSMGGIMNALRLLLVGTAKGPHLGDIMAVIGKEESIRRINEGVVTLT